MLSFNSYGEVTYTKVGSIFYGSDGSKCEVDYLGDMDCSAQLGRSQSLTDDAGNAGEMMGQALEGIFNSLFGGNSNNQSITPMKGIPYYDFGTTYEWKGQYGDFGYGSDGMECWFDSSNTLNCNNGVTYSECGNLACGSDGTTYQSSNTNASTSDYYCITSSFGSKCCGTLNYKTCR